VWERKELTVGHVVASACLPWRVQAFEIDGVACRDGGFTLNPPLQTEGGVAI
jgi:predicted acylesterase/phospholipase RssA